MSEPGRMANKKLTGIYHILLILLFISLPEFARGQSGFVFQNSLLKEIITTIQNETDYYFLYRESQIAGIRLTFTGSNDQVLDNLKSSLRSENIDLLIDDTRNQVLLVSLQQNPVYSRLISVRGQIVDSSTGERLPYATVSWYEDDALKGVTTNSSGHFSIHTGNADSRLEITASYLGFQKRTLIINTDESTVTDDVTIRLEPEPITGREIIISGFSGYNPADTLLSGLMDAARFSPLGETSSIRAIQSHPAVSNGAAINNGLNVRGSTPDGFRVLLDGMTIFNQSHLFGLLDSFNPDAIQSAGFYYGVAPAHIDSPTGGTLNLITRTGSMNSLNVSAGISNTSVNGTLDGPLGNRGSWLISARTSYIDRLSWFNNRELIRWGLDIDRPRIMTVDQTEFSGSILQPGEQSASFYDIHGKFYLEGKNADRFIFSGYYGGNDISQSARRRTRSLSSDNRFTFEEVEARNEWLNALASMRYEREISSSIFSSTQVGVSAYTTDFRKDDFVYSRVSDTGDSESILVFVYPFLNRSSMNEFRAHQDLEFRYADLTANIGVNWSYYYAEYREESFDRPSYSSETGSHLADAYLQTRWEPFSFLEFQAGIRGHYYSLGNSYHAAPRSMITIRPFDPIRLYGGYSGNFQFLHKVTLENNTTADVWTLSTADQPPAEAEQYLAGISYAPLPAFYLQAEAYIKSYRNLRSHELNTRSLANTFSDSPWFFQNDGEASGIELLIRNRFSRYRITQTYTLSEMTFTNPLLNEGEPFYADWDRKHTYKATLETTVSDGLTVSVAWLMMSGAPNKLFTFGNDSSTERLSSYHRLDAGISYNGNIGGSLVEARFSLYNILNRNNVWYRDYSFNFDETQAIPRLTPVPADVLDLGFQPSFKLTVRF
jgi:hypothetical protein